jgi:hypothetical protein
MGIVIFKSCFLNKLFLLTRYAFAYAVMIFCIPAEAFAQNHSASSLTESNIKSFIEQSTRMTSRSLDTSVDTVVAFFETHLHSDARFKSTLTFHIPENPSQEKSMTLDKNEFIENVRSGAQSLSDYKTDVRVSSVKISSDGRKATVQTKGTESGKMSVEGHEVPVEGQSSCDQIIMLSDDDIIQMYNANCNTDITFKNF